VVVGATARAKGVGWAKARRDVPTIYPSSQNLMVGTLRFAHPTKSNYFGSFAFSA
jgi:hypothetical protein